MVMQHEGWWEGCCISEVGGLLYLRGGRAAVSQTYTMWSAGFRWANKKLTTIQCI